MKVEFLTSYALAYCPLACCQGGYLDFPLIYDCVDWADLSVIACTMGFVFMLHSIRSLYRFVYISYNLLCYFTFNHSIHIHSSYFLYSVAHPNKNGLSLCNITNDTVDPSTANVSWLDQVITRVMSEVGIHYPVTDHLRTCFK